MLKIAIIIGSTRPGRKTDKVADWVFLHASRRGDASFELVDIAAHELPLLDEAMPPILGKYEKAHTRAWAAKISRFDAFVFVTPEYNHGVPAALKNAIDFLHAEWNDKPAAFVAHGNAGGSRAVEALRLVMGEIRVATVRTSVLLSVFDDFESYVTFKPRPHHERTVQTMLDELVEWGEAFRQMRQRRRERA